VFLDYFIKVFQDNKKNDAIIWKGKTYTYDWLLTKYIYWQDVLQSDDIKSGTVVIIEADFSPNAVSLLLALIENGCIIVPITESVSAKKDEFVKIAEGEVLIKIDNNDNVKISELPNTSKHKLYKNLKDENRPGLVLFSSGSTGKSKASLHDMTHLLDKFKLKRHTLRTVTFLLYDHIGGFNTLFYILSNAGLIITLNDRSPDKVLEAVEKYKVELLPTSPTFLNLILISEAYKRHDINSLKIITYGTEPMPESTLIRFNQIFPNIKLLQTYGLSEVGILRSKSKSSNSLWVKVGGEGFDTRIVDGMLEIKAKSAMLGYLNADSPFTKDGWFKTGDSVEVNGEYIKITGRKSEIINVGGEKVYPQEIENIILEVDNVAEATVYAEKNPIMGNIVCAEVRLLDNQDHSSYVKLIKMHCMEKLARFKVPVKIRITNQNQYSGRFKKRRILNASSD
tara:strand:+ start:1244 stop:2602 length:1359 start_codon:yes stop_codon:yes gene_type:complete